MSYKVTLMQTIISIIVLLLRLKNLKDVDKWSSLSLYLQVRGMSVTCELGLVGKFPKKSFNRWGGGGDFQAGGRIS